jgi:hypothetical protein
MANPALLYEKEENAAHDNATKGRRRTDSLGDGQTWTRSGTKCASSSGMVLEIETGSEKAVRGAKMDVTRASTQLGTRWQHWHIGTKVFAKPAGEIRRRCRRPEKSE